MMWSLRRQVKLEPSHEFVILACDGVWDVLSNKAAVSLVRKAVRQGQTAEQAAESLCKRALKQGSMDNISVVVIVFKEPARA